MMNSTNHILIGSENEIENEVENGEILQKSSLSNRTILLTFLIGIVASTGGEPI